MVIDEARSKATLSFIVKNVSNLTIRNEDVQCESSPSEYIRNLLWYISVGRKVDGEENTLGLFLKCKGNSAGGTWSCNVKATLKILSWTEVGKYVEEKFERLLTSELPSCGNEKFLPWTELFAPENGYIRDDSIAVEVYIEADEPDGLLWDSKKLTGIVGLGYQGSTCYLNSVLQCLYSIRQFRKAIYEVPTKHNEDRKTVTFASQKTFYELQSSDKPVETQTLIQSLGLNSTDYFSRHDAHSFLQLFFEKLQIETKGTSAEKIIPQLFEGKKIIINKCKDVCHPLTQEETYLNIELNIRGKKDILKSFTDHLKPEIFSDGNKYDAKEHGLQDAERRVAFLSFPPVLILSLKRFQFNPVVNSSIKFNGRFEFFEKISLDSFLGNPLLTSLNYSLCAVLAHSGIDFNGISYDGSHIVYICPENDGKWYKFVNQIVSECTKEEAVNGNFGDDGDGEGDRQLDPKFCSTAYMLVYVRDSELKNVLQNVPEEDIPKELVECLQKETRLEELKKKGGTVAYSYLTVHILREENFEGHQGFGLYDPGLAEHQVMRVKKELTWQNFNDHVAKTLNYSCDQIRLWPFALDEKSPRPKPINIEEGSQKCITDFSTNHNPWIVFVEEASQKSGPRMLPPYDEDLDTLLFFKLYDPKLMKILCCGHRILSDSKTIYDLLPILNSIAGFPPNSELEIYVETSDLEVKPLLVFEKPLIEVFDHVGIIIFQRKSPPEVEADYLYKTPMDYLSDCPVEVAFCDKAIPDDPGLKFQIQMKTAQDEVTEKIAQTLQVFKEQIQLLMPGRAEGAQRDSTMGNLKRTMKEFLTSSTNKIYYWLLPISLDESKSGEDCQHSEQLRSDKQPDLQKHIDLKVAYSYMEVNVLFENSFDGHQGPDLFDPKHVQYQLYREKKNTTLLDFLDHVSTTLNRSVKQIRPWPLLKRSNGTCRPGFIDVEQDLLRSISDISENQNPWNVFIEVAPSDSDSPFLPPYIKDEDVLLFFKFYDPKLMKMFYCGHCYLPKDQTMYDLILILNERAGFPPSTRLHVYEEVKPNLLEPILNHEAPLRKVIEDIMDGDIIIFQKKEPPSVETQYEFKYPMGYLRAYNSKSSKDLKKPSFVAGQDFASNGFSGEIDDKHSETNCDQEAGAEPKHSKTNGVLTLKTKSTEDEYFLKSVAAELNKIENEKTKRILKAKFFSSLAEVDDEVVEF